MHPLFPALPHFLVLARQETVRIDLTAPYRKHADLNRYTILTDQGPLRLTAEVAGPRWQVPYGDIQLGYTTHWPEKHLKSLRSAYRAAPYFDHYEARLKQLFGQRPAFLYEFSLAALTFCLSIVKDNSAIEILTQASHSEGQITSSSHIITADTDVLPPTEALPAYRSVFGADFDASVSVLDALFCVGPHRLRSWAS